MNALVSEQYIDIAADRAVSLNEAVLPANMNLDQKIDRAISAIVNTVKQGYEVCASYSGGKDSSITLNLTLSAIIKLKAQGVTVPTIHVIHSDTGVENPVVHAYNKRQLRQIKAYSKASGIKMKVWVATPSLSNDYLVSMLGGRTIASVGNNSKCQQMLKAAPLKQIKKRVARYIAEQKSVKLKDVEIVSLVGTRFDESATRGNKMSERGESAVEAVNLTTATDELVLSPIADFTTFDVFEYIGRVRSGVIEAYDSFDELVKLYRDMNAGDCMVTAYISGKEVARPPCSARTGCYICTRVSTDASAENMIASDSGEFDWMRPLNALRNFIAARHFDPSARCWLGRTVNEETGTIVISPNTYSPEYTKQLLGIVLTIQRDEQRRARAEGRAPHFTMLTLQQLIGVDVLWARYGYQQPFTALRMYKEIYGKGKRYEIPDLKTIQKYTRKDIEFRLEVPFCDREYFAPFNGLRNIDHAAADWEQTVTLRNGQVVTQANTGDEFEIDEEGAELFWEFEVDNALNRISLDTSPSSAIHYLVGLGTLTIYKGSLGEWDRMLRLGNQIHRYGLKPMLSDPKAILGRLNDLGVLPAAEASGEAAVKPTEHVESALDAGGDVQLSLFADPSS